MRAEEVTGKGGGAGRDGRKPRASTAGEKTSRPPHRWAVVLADTIPRGGQGLLENPLKSPIHPHKNTRARASTHAPGTQCTPRSPPQPHGHTQTHAHIHTYVLRRMPVFVSSGNGCPRRGSVGQPRRGRGATGAAGSGARGGHRPTPLPAGAGRRAAALGGRGGASGVGGGGDRLIQRLCREEGGFEGVASP